VLLVDGAHERGGGRQDLIDEDEDGLLGRQLDALADHVDELAHCEVGGDQVLLLVDGRDVRLLDLLADDLAMRALVCRAPTSSRGSGGWGRSWLTGMRSEYFCRMRSASALRFSKGCSSLNLERIFTEFAGFVGVCVSGGCRFGEEWWWLRGCWLLEAGSRKKWDLICMMRGGQ
jgi:hypothetical protein